MGQDARPSGCAVAVHRSIRRSRATSRASLRSLCADVYGADSSPRDLDGLAELRRDEAAGRAFSIYLRAKDHEGAIITITEEGDLVLGLILDDPNNSRWTLWRARLLPRRQFSSPAGLAGVALPPPQSLVEWDEAATVQVRSGRPTP